MLTVGLLGLRPPLCTTTSAQAQAGASWHAGLAAFLRIPKPMQASAGARAGSPPQPPPKCPRQAHQGTARNQFGCAGLVGLRQQLAGEPATAAQAAASCPPEQALNQTCPTGVRPRCAAGPASHVRRPWLYSTIHNATLPTVMRRRPGFPAAFLTCTQTQAPSMVNNTCKNCLAAAHLDVLQAQLLGRLPNLHAYAGTIDGE